jgi:hypothetical protein
MKDLNFFFDTPFSIANVSKHESEAESLSRINCNVFFYFDKNTNEDGREF